MVLEVVEGLRIRYLKYQVYVNYLAKKADMFWMFTEFEKAHDRFDSDEMWDLLRLNGVH